MCKENMNKVSMVSPNGIRVGDVIEFIREKPKFPEKSESCSEHTFYTVTSVQNAKTNEDNRGHVIVTLQLRWPV